MPQTTMPTSSVLSDDDPFPTYRDDVGRLRCMRCARRVRFRRDGSLIEHDCSTPLPASQANGQTSAAPWVPSFEERLAAGFGLVSLASDDGASDGD